VSLLQIYWRALGYLAADRKRVALICGANVALAAIAILEPIMFGRVIGAISERGSVFQTLAMWAGLGAFNIVAFVLVARGADRFAHKRRSEVLCQSFERVITMPLAWHHQRGTSNALHTLLRAVETLFSLWLEFMRQHLSTAVALVLLVPTAISMDLRMSLVLLGLGVLYVGIGRLVMRRTKEGQAAVERHYHQVFAHVTDSVSNVAVLQSYNRIGHETEALKRYVKNLLDAQKNLGLSVQLARLINVDLDPSRHRIVLDVGANQGCEIGQPVIDAQGVMGQIVEVLPNTSIAMLISDATHAIPVVVERTGLRTIAYGSGEIDRLQLPNIPISADVRVGDRLLTSGLGGRFPAGFPVGEIRKVSPDRSGMFTAAEAQPAAALDRSAEVLLLHDQPQPYGPPAPRQEIGPPASLAQPVDNPQTAGHPPEQP